MTTTIGSSSHSGKSESDGSGQMSFSLFIVSVMFLYFTFSIVITFCLNPIFSPHSAGQSRFLTKISQVEFPKQKVSNYPISDL